MNYNEVYIIPSVSGVIMFRVEDLLYAASQYLFVSYNVNCFFIYCILKGNRDESTTVDVAKAQKEAQDLFQVQKIVLKLSGSDRLSINSL